MQMEGLVLLVPLVPQVLLVFQDPKEGQVIPEHEVLLVELELLEPVVHLELLEELEPLVLVDL